MMLQQHAQQPGAPGQGQGQGQGQGRPGAAAGQGVVANLQVRALFTLCPLLPFHCSLPLSPPITLSTHTRLPPVAGGRGGGARAGRRGRRAVRGAHPNRRHPRVANPNPVRSRRTAWC
jgi:hypothetical protein